MRIVAFGAGSPVAACARTVTVCVAVLTRPRVSVALTPTVYAPGAAVASPVNTYGPAAFAVPTVAPLTVNCTAASTPSGSAMLAAIVRVEPRRIVAGPR